MAFAAHARHLEVRRLLLLGRIDEAERALAESALLVLSTPAARRIAKGEERLLRLNEVEELLASEVFIVDACRHSGLESNGGDQFFCGGGRSGKVRAVRRPT